jgi:hypothetical protein
VGRRAGRVWRRPQASPRGASLAGGNPEPAIEALRAFLRTHADARQTLGCLENLGRLLVTSGQPVNDAYQGLTQLRGKYGNDAKDLAGRCDLLRVDLLALDLAARHAYMLALAGKQAEAQSAWESQLKAADDPHTRAAIHLARGDYLRLTQKYREAMWDYLWVDTVYFAESEQQAKALYHLTEVFDKLGDTVKSREAKERLLADTRLKDTRYQKMTVR